MFQYNYYSCFPEIQVCASKHMPSAESITQKMWVNSTEPSSDHPSGIWNFEVAAKFLKNFGPLLTSKCRITSASVDSYRKTFTALQFLSKIITGDKHIFMRMTPNKATTSSEWPITSAPKEGQKNLFSVKGTLIVLQHLWNAMTCTHLYFDVLWHLCKDIH